MKVLKGAICIVTDLPGLPLFFLFYYKVDCCMDYVVTRATCLRFASTMLKLLFPYQYIYPDVSLLNLISKYFFNSTDI